MLPYTAYMDPMGNDVGVNSFENPTPFSKSLDTTSAVNPNPNRSKSADSSETPPVPHPAGYSQMQLDAALNARIANVGSSNHLDGAVVLMDVHHKST